MTKNLLLKEGLKFIDLKDSFDQTLNPAESLFLKMMDIGIMKAIN